MEFLNITESKRKIAYLRSNAGPELIIFWEKEVGIRNIDIPTNRDMPVLDMHIYMELNWESRNSLLKLVNRDWAIMDIMKHEQRDKGFMDS